MERKSKIVFSTRSIILFTILLFASALVFAQAGVQSMYEKKAPSAMLGAGLGINDYGLGLCLEVPLVEKLTVYGNAGIGGWGGKLGAGFSFYPAKFPYKSSISVGYATASGLKDFETDLPVEPNNQTQKVLLDLHRVGTVNLVYSYNFRMGKKSKFSLSTGYAIKVTDDPYQLKSNGVTLSNDAKTVIDIVQPGGFIIGARFLIGLD